MAKILAIDDDVEILKVISRALERVGHEVTTVVSALDVKESTYGWYDLILLDVMMEQMDGFEFCRSIRSQVDCPIVFLTARSMEEDLVLGLSVGGDDYIVKPFGIAELRARVEAHLRREKREKKNCFTVNGVRFDLLAQEAWAGEVKLPLTRSEYDICEYLAKHRGQVFTKEQILTAVFGFDGESEPAAITEHIKNIRAKCKTCNVSPIETVWGVGYKWCIEEKQ